MNTFQSDDVGVYQVLAKRCEIVFKVHLLMGSLSIYQVKSTILGIFLVLKCALMCALDSFENDFLGSTLIKSGKELYI